MSATEPVLRRSARTAAKRDVSAVDAPAAPTPVQKKKRSTPAAEKKSTTKTAAEKAKSAVAKAVKAATGENEKEKPPATPALIEGEIIPATVPAVNTHGDEEVNIAELVAKAEKGIVIFAYPKASTPGCTRQACFFRDNYADFKAAGYAVYGLSSDKPSANTKFHEKQTLGDIVLLCDPEFKLHELLGIKKDPKGTVRSVTVIEKTEGGAKIIKKSPASPEKSVDIAKKAIGI